eukprot:5576571-Lingulodinium_polyedra.AAC.1
MKKQVAVSLGEAARKLECSNRLLNEQLEVMDMKQNVSKQEVTPCLRSRSDNRAFYKLSAGGKKV